MQASDFHFDLPPELIAQTPLAERSASRLLILRGATAEHGQFTDLVTLLNPGDLLVLNDTRVIKARLFASKDSGGKAEVLLERIIDRHTCLAQVRVSKPLQIGRLLSCPGGDLQVLGREGVFYRLGIASGVLDLFERCGQVPLPPYITRPSATADERSYQTVFARDPGAVAAPTAGLHFSQALLTELAEASVGRAFVTLHVGAGTFSPVRGELAAHEMHKEHFRLPAETVDAINQCRARGGRVVAVGTTVVRTLETAARYAQSEGGGLRALEGETQLFIQPGFRFQVVDALITNFHLPASTLLMLVAAFAGTERTLAAYQAAVTAGYRFFSYGDAMFVTAAQDPAHV
ncbi:MAG: tRNA preQ1(34) S-adenosylmethionine ribosyltransferase-isomerase QueA [Pseudomonadales bacterium]